MKKKILIIILIVVAFLFVLFFYFSKQEEKLPSPIVLKPQIPTYIEGKLPIQSSITKDKYNVPKTASILSFNLEPITKNNALKTAESLGFTEVVNEFKDTNEGVKYYWFNDKYSLVITPKTGKIKYYSSSSEIPDVQNKQLSNDGILDNANDFISKSSITNLNNIKTTEILALKKNQLSGGLEKTSANQADVYQVNYTYNALDYEILTLDPSFPLIFVQILPDGSIHSMEITKLANLSENPDKVELKTFEDFSNTFPEAKLVSLLNDYVNISNLTVENISNITIDNVKLVYLLDSYTSQKLQPVLLLEGSALVTNSNADRAILYLPAAK